MRIRGFKMRMISRKDLKIYHHDIAKGRMFCFYCDKEIEDEFVFVCRETKMDGTVKMPYEEDRWKNLTSVSHTKCTINSHNKIVTEIKRREREWREDDKLQRYLNRIDPLPKGCL
jgi:hypothetical protein